MADLSITPATVGIADDAKVVSGVAGEAIDRGEAVAFDDTTGKYVLADNTVEALASVVGIAQSDASADGDYLLVQKTGSIKFDATLTLGQLYYLSSTPGKIAPFSDLDSSDYVSSVFRATAASTAILDMDYTGIVLA